MDRSEKLEEVYGKLKALGVKYPGELEDSDLLKAVLELEKIEVLEAGFYFIENQLGKLFDKLSEFDVD